VTRAEPEGGRTRPAVIARMVLVVGTGLLAGLIVLAGSIGPAYGRTRRAGVAASLGSRVVLRALGIRVLRTGRARDGAALVVADQGSWVDLLAITATAPVVPVASCEVAQRALIGPLARRTGTVFVSPRIGRDLPATGARITGALRRGHRVLLFPAGTTAGGGPPGGFHRAGFQAAVDAAVPVQAVSIGYTDRRGRPTGSTALLGADSGLGSAWRVLRTGPVCVRVRWHAPAAATVDGGHRARHRARAARHARGRISDALGAGRPAVDPARAVTTVTSVSGGASATHVLGVMAPSPDQPARAA